MCSLFQSGGDEEVNGPNVQRPPSDWPFDGKIEFHKLKMRYRDGLPLALKGVTCKIAAQEKIGIVGRSGSGQLNCF